jgi:polysaccharide biosynthesis protein VpsM
MTVYSSLWITSTVHADFDLIDMSSIRPGQFLISGLALEPGQDNVPVVPGAPENATSTAGIQANGVNEPEIIGIKNDPALFFILEGETGSGQNVASLFSINGTSGMLIAANTADDDKLLSESAAPGNAPQTDDGYDLGGGLTIGPGYLKPGVKLGLQYDDNLTHSATDQIGTFINVISPHVSYLIPGKTLKINLDTKLEAGFHEADSVDNYVDSRIYGSADYQPTSRIYTQLAGEFRTGHDGRGTGRAEGGLGVTQDSPDEWHRWGMGGKFGYGALTAKGRVELETEYISKRYDTNRDVTFVRDLDETNGTARFFYRIRPKTYLLFEGRASGVNYQEDAPGIPSLDSLTTRQLFGVTWLATFKTTGFLKLGRINKNFASSRRTDEDGFTWEVGVDWRPRTYSTVTLKTSQDFVETDGTGDAGDLKQISIGWDHRWRSRLSTNLELLYGQETFSPDTREDKIYQASAKVKYDFRRWLNLESGYRFTNLDSTNDVFNFNQNVFEITADFTF